MDVAQDLSVCPYADIINRFLVEEFPSLPSSEIIRFEAVSRAVFGTKQRRNGPVPPPEVQVPIREILRTQDPLRFFLPWGSRKQVDGHGLDLLEVCAIKQLLQLRNELKQHGREARFDIRLEDLTDFWLFQEERQSLAYTANFVSLLDALGFSEATVHLESGKTDKATFFDLATQFTPIFYDYLTGRSSVDTIHRLGWKGNIPTEQREYYARAYRVFYPGRDIDMEMARYFAATLSRVKLNAVCAPTTPFIQICFSNPIPGFPLGGNRLYYRSIPERYTNQHRPPWIGKGYLLIDEEGNTCPRSAGIGEQLKFSTHRVRIGDALVEADYVLA